jgi:tRNA A-37 threonylcarbamoyl transferase component Bud32
MPPKAPVAPAVPLPGTPATRLPGAVQPAPEPLAAASGVEPPDDGLESAPTLLTSMPEDGEEVQSAYIGKLIDDRYLVKALIGRGGMGVVFAAEQVHLRKTMAIKLLHENLISKKQLIARFTREARAISRLSSPHTVSVYDFGRWGELFYLVMELIEGEPLDGLLEREGPLPAERVAKIVLQMCDSLAEAHKHGIVHRDLKPENIMLLRDAAHPDFVKILDFGLAKVQGVDDPYTIHSQRDIFGTPFYMSPEQIRAGDVDGRSDIYAVGALMFRMLTGEHVFRQSNTFDILRAHMMEQAPRMASVAPKAHIPEVLERVVAKALEKEPSQRFASMDELGQALALALRSGFEQTTVEAPLRQRVEVPALQPAPVVPGAAAAGPAVDDAHLADEVVVLPPPSRWRLWAFAAALLALVGGAAAWLWSSDQPRELESEPNDTAQRANLLGPGDVARGTLGKRTSDRQGDRDCFRLPAVKAGQRQTVAVQGLPNLDLKLELLTAAGKTVLASSHRGRGQGEVLHHADPALGAAVVCVTEALAEGQVAGEALSDQYTLQVQYQPAPAHAEREPNDLPPGTELQAAIATQASLDGPLDRDVFSLPGQAAERTLRVTLELPAGADTRQLRLTLLDGSRRPVAMRRVTAGELQPGLAFVGALDQLADVAVVQRWPAGNATPAGDVLPYAIRYEIHDGQDQAEAEPNNTEESAQPVVLGAWHRGDCGDSAAVDWLRVEAPGGAPTRLQVEIASEGGPVMLLVQDLGSRVNLRQGTVTAGAAQVFPVQGSSGEGFLLKVTPVAEPAAKRREAARWRLRVRAAAGALSF